MAIRNSLVLVSGGHAASAVEAAFMLSDRVVGHVAGLHPTGDPIDNLPRLAEGLTERQIARAFETARARIESAEREARDVFTAVAERHGATLSDEPRPGAGVVASWHAVEGGADRVLAEQARIYDMLVSTAVHDDAAGEAVLDAVEHALFDAGRPVLVVPRQAPRSVGRRILIGWNRTANAARAVMAAMPLILAAERVTVCHVTTGAKSGPSPEALAASLAWHGVDAAVRKIPPGGAPISDLLTEEAEREGDDLVVMGAYSHSRMREYVLGGVTHYALRHVVTPLLMMH